MSDFLTRASEAALGLSRAVKPLVASRYGPGPRAPVLELETAVEQSTAGGLVSAAKSDALADRPAALNAVVNAPEQTSESNLRAEDRVGSLKTRGMESVNALPDAPVSTRQDELAATAQPVEHITEPEAVFVSTPSDDPLSANAKVSFRAETLREPASEPERQLSTTWVAPLSVPLISSEAARTHHALTDENAVGESGTAEPPSSFSFAPADRPHLDHHQRGAVVEGKLDVVAGEAVRTGDDAKPQLDQVNVAAIVPVRSDQVSRSDAVRQLDQPSSNLREEWNDPDNSARRSVATHAISETATTADRGRQDGPPIIRVTIGRIDVRAVAPPSPPVQAAAAPASPKLSLDEYLRQHNGRRS